MSEHVEPLKKPDVEESDRATTVLIVLGAAFMVLSLAFVAVREFGFGNRASTGGGADAPVAPAQYQKPTGSDAVHPELKGMIQRAAKDHGISEEEARQAFIAGGRKGYSKDQVEKQFGK